jgi:hypothetical protein
MTKKESNKDQIWLTVFITVPVILLGKLGGDVSKLLGINSILTSALLGGIGALIGYGLRMATEKLSTIIKVSILIGLFVVFGVVVRIFLAPKTDEQLLSSEWNEQKIGTISFAYPDELKLSSTSIPEGTESIYSKLEIYSDGGEDRVMSFIYSELLTDSLVLENTFSGSLEAMLKSIGVEDVQLVDSYIDEQEVVSKFSFQRNSKELLGFGYMRLVERQLQSIWLLPVTRTFSEDFLNKFEAKLEPEMY